MNERAGSALQLLELLADGRFHSGEEIASRLGQTRAAVWKRMRSLEAAGIRVEKARAVGYRLATPVELLRHDRISAALGPQASALLSQLVVLESTVSTNEHCLRGLATGSIAPGTAVFAEQQTGGRGRRGRAWLSPLARNLYLSLTWRFAEGIAAVDGLSLAVGVAVVCGLRRLGVDGVGLKWPNDIVAADRKLGGVLIEMHGDVDGPLDVVIGIGLNVRMPDVPAEAIDQPWTEVDALLEPPASRNAVAGAVLGECLLMLRDFAGGGVASLLEAWRGLDVMAGRPVRVTLGNQVHEGVAAGIDAGGAFLLRTAEGERAFRGGEVTLRARS